MKGVWGLDIRARLKSGEPVIGSWINTGSVAVAELMAGVGLDFLTLDGEHSPVGVAEVYAMAQAIRAGSSDCVCLARVPDIRYHTIKQFMDAGAQGVVAPLVTTGAQAQEVVDAVKYPPHGKRGVGFAPSNAYGRDLADHLAEEHEKSVVVVQIEHVEALENIDDILSVTGVDAAMIGPYDLSASFGKPGEFDIPEMKEARALIKAACQSHNVALGIHIIQPEPEEALARIKQGYQFIAYSLDITMLADCASRGLATIRNGLSR